MWNAGCTIISAEIWLLTGIALVATMQFHISVVKNFRNLTYANFVIHYHFMILVLSVTSSVLKRAVRNFYDKNFCIVCAVHESYENIWLQKFGACHAVCLSHCLIILLRCSCLVRQVYIPSAYQLEIINTWLLHTYYKCMIIPSTLVVSNHLSTWWCDWN